MNRTVELARMRLHDSVPPRSTDGSVPWTAAIPAHQVIIDPQYPGAGSVLRGWDEIAKDSIAVSHARFFARAHSGQGISGLNLSVPNK
jgi:hypothetical protein